MHSYLHVEINDKERMARLRNSSRLRALTPADSCKLEVNVIRWSRIAVGALLAIAAVCVSGPIIESLPAAGVLGTHGREVLFIIPAAIGFLLGSTVAANVLDEVLNKIYMLKRQHKVPQALSTTCSAEAIYQPTGLPHSSSVHSTHPTIQSIRHIDNHFSINKG